MFHRQRGKDPCLHNLVVFGEADCYVLCTKIKDILLGSLGSFPILFANLINSLIFEKY